MMTRSRDVDSSPFALLGRAEVLLQSRDATAACKLAKKILRADRTHVGALEVLARSLWQMQDFQELIAITRRLIKLDPYNPGYHMLRGATFQCLSMFGEATKCYARATAHGNSPDADRSMQLISELRDWQANLLSTLLEEDPAFRAAYSRDPQAACQSKGFEFVDMSARGKWLRDDASATILARPS